MLLGPDDKIYLTKTDYFGAPIEDTYYTSHMDVILNPNGLDSACDYRSFYFDLGSGHTMQGLPTMVNYNLGPVAGSICDSLSTSVFETETEKYFELFPNPFSDKLILRLLNSSQGIFTLHDQLGKIILREKFSGERTFNLAMLTAGVYYVRVEIDGKDFNAKVVKVSDR
jgi:hypothetical protein